MEQMQAKLRLMLGELRDQIIEFVENNQLSEANLLLEQYIKLAPTQVERYSLDAMVKTSAGDLDGAIAVLTAGVAQHPLAFDLLYNLGYVYQQKKEILEAYHIYMKARYAAGTDQETMDIGQALRGLVKDIKGNVKASAGQIATIVRAGKLTMTITAQVGELLYRKGLLGHIETRIAQNASTVLEIGFKDGIIGKNLNYFGYAVTAVDGAKERILQVIAREWHDNILHPEQRVAKFYHEFVDLEWLGKIPEFEIIIAVGDSNLKEFNAEHGQASALLAALLQKAQKQVFITVANSQTDKDFSKQDLVPILEAQGLELETIAVLDATNGLELCLINKEPDLVHFTVPLGVEVQHSDSTVFDVELAKCVDLYGAGYLDDWHPFVAVLKEQQANPALEYKDSILKEYYRRFRPRNLEEALFAKERKGSRLNRGWTGFPWFWDKSRRMGFQSKPNETRPGGNHFFGPNSDEFGASEYKRLLPLHKIMKEQGYHPELFPDGYLSGYLMIKGDDYRFVVTEGQHRIACLALLGYRTIRCRFTQQPQYPQIVFWQEVKKWPQVANGLYSMNLALRVFDRFFAENVGKERMGLE